MMPDIKVEPSWPDTSTKRLIFVAMQAVLKTSAICERIEL
jgi:hypothetical protein